MKLENKSKNQILYSFPNGDCMLINIKFKMVEHYYKEQPKDRIMTALGDFKRFLIC